MCSPAVFAGMFLLATSLSAQVFVVDVNNGAGTHFTDLPTAAATVPDGATLLVRAGMYSPFAIAGKGLKVVGEGNVSLLAPLGGVLSVGGTQSRQSVLLRNLELATPLHLTDCGGAVVLDGCREGAIFSFWPPRGVVITRCANVWVHACTLIPNAAVTSNPPAAISVDGSQLTVSRSVIHGVQGPSHPFFPNTGTPGISLSQSRVLVVASTIRGGNGSQGCASCGLPGCRVDAGDGGAAGVVGSAATLLALGSQFLGGDGGNGANCSACFCCTTSGNGGPGLALGRAVVLGTTVRGGSVGSAAVATEPPVRSTSAACRSSTTAALERRAAGLTARSSVARRSSSRCAPLPAARLSCCCRTASTSC